MNSVIDAIYRDGRFVGRGGEIIEPFPASIRREEGEALYHMVRRLRPSRTLEIGMAWGLSTLFLCQALEDNGLGDHTAIDPYQAGAFKRQAVFNIDRAGLSHRLAVIEESSQLVLPRLVTENQRFGLIFIDGSHLFDDVFVDFFFADQLIPLDGVLVFDDLWMPAVRKVLEFALTNRSYEIAEDLLGERPSFVVRHWKKIANSPFQRLTGKSNLGAPSEWKFHQGRNINWCPVRKIDTKQRPWDHYAAF